NLKQASDLLALFAGGWGPDRRRSGPQQTVFFIFYCKALMRNQRGVPVRCRFTLVAGGHGVDVPLREAARLQDLARRQAAKGPAIQLSSARRCDGLARGPPGA